MDKFGISYDVDPSTIAWYDYRSGQRWKICRYYITIADSIKEDPLQQTTLTCFNKLNVKVTMLW